MALTVPEATVLRQALTYRDETFERSVGRAVRRNGGTYADYLGIMSKLRKAAQAESVTVREIAKRLADHP